MHIPRSLALIACLAFFPTASHAQGFSLEEAASIADTPIAQIKPRTIVFSDKTAAENEETGGVFMRYEDWAKARPLQQQMLSLYPGYTEPNLDLIIDGAKRRFREKLHMYVAQARFVVPRAPGSIDLSRLA